MTPKSLAKKLLHDLGGIQAFRIANSKGIRILMYHRFQRDPDGLKSQCEIIRRHYSPVSLDSVSEYVRNRQSLPANAVAVTIDDGFRDFLFAHPVFREYDIPVTVFLVSDFLDGKLWLWFNQIDYAMKHTKRDSLTIELESGQALTLSLANDKERRSTRTKITDVLKQMNNSQRVMSCEQIIDKLQVEIPTAPPEEYAPLTWSEVRKLSKDGVDFGAHTRTHPILSRIEDHEQLKDEIATSKRRIEEELNKPAVHFCYPNGKLTDFSDATLKIVEKCGFQSAVTTEPGMNYQNAQPFLLRRLGTGPTDPSQYFQELLAGVRKE